jgi:hypothetical protein
VTKDDGTDWRASELDLGRILVSGPTSNYQRVLAERSDLVTAARTNADGSMSYTFADPIPATYLPPLNDSDSFDEQDGELAGQALASGTYTVGLYVAWNYTVEDESFRDPANATVDFLLGDAPALEHREVVKLDNCNRCHSTLQAHGGTRYTVGMRANRDFTVTPLRALTTTGAWDNIGTDNTTYRMISPPATRAFLYGNARAITENEIISSGANCNACHGDLQAHGFGRRGLETCLLCHRTPGAEDGAPYSFAGWYVPPTPGVTMDFRTLLHKVHMGEELAHASSYVVDGVFLGTAYPVTYEDVAFPSLPGGALDCRKCHGEESTSWHEPASRTHPDPLAPPARDWRAVCGACHDSDAAAAHVDVRTSSLGSESCAVCHGPEKEWSVELVHRIR